MENNRIKHLVFMLVVMTFFVGAQYSFLNISVPPRPTGPIYVQDYAGTLNDTTEQKIREISSDLDKNTTAQVSVVFVPSLRNQAIGTYTSALFQRWGIGNQTARNGVLLLISKQENEARIEVGSGLRKSITNGKVSKILRGMTPFLKNKDYNNGVLYGFGKIAELVAQEYNIPLQLDDSIPKTSPANTLPPWLIGVAIGASVLLISIIVLIWPKRHQSVDTIVPDAVHVEEKTL